MKFECKECRTPCKLDWGDSELYKPTECPAGLKEANWREVAEPAALPKLTVEALAERGIEWPEWATAAATSDEGASFFCSRNPAMSDDEECWNGGGRVELIPGKWDASDWQSSKIMRPEKVAKLPDWLKLGAWAAVGKFVGKIDWLSRDGSECRITCGESRFAKRDEVKPVTWRAWTFEEAPEAVKCTVNGQTGIVYLNFLKDQYGNSWCGYQYLKSGDLIGFDQMLKEATQLSGLPCGVPQVEGVDLEIRPCD